MANYRSGSVAVFEIEDDGSLGAMTGHIQHEGASAHPVRRAGPHAHMVAFDPGSGDVLVPDLGIDAVIVYTLTEHGELVEHRGGHRAHTRRRASAPRISSRRRLSLYRQRLDNTLVSLGRNGEKFVPVSTTSTLPAGFDGHSQAAAIRVSPSGNWVLVSNRGVASDSVAVVRFDVDEGTLELAGLQSTYGREAASLSLPAPAAG